jgi:hypothetical protein
MNSRLATITRGALIPLVLKKTLVLPQSLSEDSASVTLVSTDLDGIATGLTGLHELWAQFAEIGLGLYLLNNVVGEATRTALIAVISKLPPSLPFACSL